MELEFTTVYRQLLTNQNKCLLSKWIVNLLNGEGTWQSLLRNKYLSSSLKEEVQAKPNDSHFWRGLMKIKEEVLACGSFEIKDGKQTRFWEDTWVGQRPFKEQYPSIYNIARQPSASVASVLSSDSLNISFRRALVDEKLQEWLDLVAKITNINLVEGSDHFRWNLHKYGVFTVRSMYLHKINQHAPFRHKLIWKLKISLKIKIFFWFLQRGVILTKR